MSLSKLAYGPDALALVTFDGKELLANDAQTEAPKWRLALTGGVVALHFADSDALPGGGGGSPWRRSSAGCTLVAVDEAGGVHSVDPVLGQSVAKVGPLGAPVGSAAGYGGFALATKDTIHLWRRGESLEIAARASAIAFSNDGTTLVYAEDGSLHFVTLDASNPPKETSRAVVGSGVTCLAQHPSGTWLVGGESGLSTVKDGRDQRIDAVPSKVVGLAFDGAGTRLAVQTSDLRVIVLAWPSLTLEAEVLSPERAVRGLAFGPGDWLGLAFDAGDAVKIDVVTSSTRRTEAHPGRQPRSFRLSVRGKKELLSEKEAEDVRRMKTLLHDAPQGGSSKGGRIGIGAGISLAVLAMRLVFAGTSGSTYSPPPFDGKLSPAHATTCHRECAEARLASVVTYCAAKPCERHAKAARDALVGGDCARAKAALAKVTFQAGSNAPADVLGNASRVVAGAGLEEACSSDFSLKAPVRRAVLVMLDDARLAETTKHGPGCGSEGNHDDARHSRCGVIEEGMKVEVVPSVAGARNGESLGSLWVAPDGTLFLSTMEGTWERSFVHRRRPDGSWDIVATRRSSTPVRMWGRSATDMYVLDRNSLAHFDGADLTELDVPLTTTYALAGVGADLVVSGMAPDDADASAGGVGRALRLHLGKWVPDTTPVGLVPELLWPAGSAGTWGFAFDNGKSRVLFRSPNGAWAERGWPAEAAEKAPVVWAAASGEALLGTHQGVFRTANRGASWSPTGDPGPGKISALWGRTANDVYALTSRGLSHYDGKTWSPTGFKDEAELLSGTEKSVFVVVRE